MSAVFHLLATLVKVVLPLLISTCREAQGRRHRLVMDRRTHKVAARDASMIQMPWSDTRVWRHDYRLAAVLAVE